MGNDDLVTVAKMCGERSAEIEKSRQLPSDIADALIGTGVMRTWVPTRYGGAGGTVLDLIDAIETVAYQDGSAGWCVMIGGTTGLNAGFLPPEWGQSLFGEATSCGGGLVAPSGTAVQTEAGLRVDGTWAWGSGTSHCTTIGGGVRIVDESGEPTELADGSTTCFAFFDVDDVELFDTWHSSGLKGTGSTDYQVVNATVPHDRWVALGSKLEPVDDNPLYRFSPFGALALGVSAVLVGLARRAVDELILLGGKQAAGSGRSLAERAPVQADLARAEAAVRSSRAFIEEVVDECWQAAKDDGQMTGEHKRILRLAANTTAERCAKAVDICYHAGGGTSVYETSPLQRVFRDAHVATQHAMVAERVLEPLGRMRFGLPTSTSQF